jgi:hypothetical protein
VQNFPALKETIAMAKPRYEYSEVAKIRGWVEEELQNLPASKNEDEAPEEFWSRVEQAGLLVKALARYDELAAEYAAWRQTQRETKTQFDQRMEREGRQAEAERVRAKLLASGMSKREAQVALVERMQPLDGTKTRAWETPDPWEEGRLFKKKAEQQQVLDLATREEGEEEDKEVTEAKNRLYWAERRRDEREALVDARRRARDIKREQERHQRKAKRVRARKGGLQKTSTGKRRWVDSELI